MLQISELALLTLRHPRLTSRSGWRNRSDLNQMAHPDYQAARQVASHGYAWKGLATLAALPFGIFIRPTTVTLINREIQQHYERIEFADKFLMPNGVAQGFVYFKLPGGWFSSKRLENLTVNVTVEEDTYGEHNGNPVHFQLPLPKLEVS